jgi:hypothetical protein
MTANDWSRRDYFRSKVIPPSRRSFHAHQPQGGPEPVIPSEAGRQGLVNGCLETITFQNV